MGIARWFTQRVDVYRAELVTDTHGSDRRDWSTGGVLVAQELDGPLKGRLAQFSTEEQLEQRDATVTLFHLRLPAGVDLEAGDRVLVDGRRFTVEAEPNRARDRRREHHVHAICRRLGSA